MEKYVYLRPTEETPKVVLNPDKNEFLIAGRSLPEDATLFYAPIHNWVDEYIKHPNKETVLNIELEYFNSSSAKQIILFLLKFENIKQAGNTVKIIWNYNEDDDLMLMKGEEIKEIVGVPVELNVIKN